MRMRVASTRMGEPTRIRADAVFYNHIRIRPSENLQFLDDADADL